MWSTNNGISYDNDEERTDDAISMRTNKSQTYCQSDFDFTENYSVTRTISTETGVQASSSINSDNNSNDGKKRKTEANSDTQAKSKRGRGRGARGSYKPRGKVKNTNTTMTVPTAVMNSYQIQLPQTNSYNNSNTNTLPRVCVNPEILKILGYSNQNSNTYTESGRFTESFNSDSNQINQQYQQADETLNYCPTSDDIQQYPLSSYQCDYTELLFDNDFQPQININCEDYNDAYLNDMTQYLQPGAMIQPSNLNDIIYPNDFYNDNRNTFVNQTSNTIEQQFYYNQPQPITYSTNHDQSNTYYHQLHTNEEKPVVLPPVSTMLNNHRLNQIDFHINTDDNC